MVGVELLVGRYLEITVVHAFLIWGAAAVLSDFAFSGELDFSLSNF